MRKEQRDGIAAESNDGVSVTYVTTSETNANERRLYQVVVLYLGNTGLLYRGVE